MDNLTLVYTLKLCALSSVPRKWVCVRALMCYHHSWVAKTVYLLAMYMLMSVEITTQNSYCVKWNQIFANGKLNEIISQ